MFKQPMYNKENREWEGIEEHHIKEWGDVYSQVDVVKELKKMKLWLEANPAKANKKQWLRFISSWLERAEQTALKYTKSNPIPQKQRYDFDDTTKDDLAEIAKINYTPYQLKRLWEGVNKISEHPGNYQDIMKHYYVHDNGKAIPKVLRGMEVEEWKPGMKSKGVRI